MSSWRNEYIAALQARDNQEKSNKELFDAYTKLADRTAAEAVPAATDVVVNEKGGKDLKRKSPPPADATSIRQNLIEAQRNRTELQTRLDTVTADLDKLRAKCEKSNARLAGLTQEKAALATKLGDRDEELKRKAKLLEEVQDENLSLTIELNAKETLNNKLEKENKELVDRWMAQKGREAEDMNSKYRF